MMIAKLFTTISLLLLTTVLWSQDITGIIINDKGETLIGATIKWKGTGIGTSSDIDGAFTIPTHETIKELEISYVGYEPVYISVEEGETNLQIEISGITSLDEVEITSKKRDNFVSTIDPLNVESITSDELCKAACCSLAESFETNAAVDVSYADAVTGATEIQLLGLRGLYTQMLIENRPALNGLGSAYSMEYLAGTWLESIQISKGTSTVRNGYQSIAGQINMELKKPWRDHGIFVNLFGNSFGRAEMNLHLNRKLNKEWSTGLLMHASTFQQEHDTDGDGFMNMPKKKVYNGVYRLFYRGKNIRGQFNIHGVKDERVGGQAFGINPNPYFINQNAERVEAFGKIGLVGLKNENSSLGFITNASWHKMDSYYGNVFHRGEQRNLFANLIYATTLKNEDHQFTSGLSYMLDEYDEHLDDNNLSRKESVPGAYMEYTFLRNADKKSLANADKNEKNFMDGFGAIVGLRVDHHNLYGTLLTPRLNTKYNFNANSIIRFSAGRGYRSPNVVAENISQLVSNRIVSIADDIDIEEAWNYGLNFTQNYVLGSREGSISVDLYRTDFVRQIVQDVEQDLSKILYYNLEGASFSNSFLINTSYELLDGLDIKLAYKFNDVQITYDGDLRQKPLVAKHRGLVTLDYDTRDKKWMFNCSAQLVGQQRMPSVAGIPAEILEHHPGDFSPAFAQLNGQVTRKFKALDIYVGVENIANYVQNFAILSYEDPFGPHFNATHVYAPTVGRRMYAGLRWSFDFKEKVKPLPVEEFSASPKEEEEEEPEESNPMIPASITLDNGFILTQIKSSLQCGMCATNIFDALIGQTGITKVDVDVDGNVINVTYDASIIEEAQVLEMISQAGYDANEVEADKEAHDSLPGCCQKSGGH